ncbi:MAG: glycosyltransferase family 2 protein [Saccharofermentanales bacterium]
MDKLYIIIPAYNEAMNIEAVAREWNEVLVKIGEAGSKLVIIDDGSRDDTYKKLCGMRDELQYLEPISKPNSGHGSTILFGYNYAVYNGADYVFQTDSDGQTLPSEFYSFWALRKQYPAIVGYRGHRQDGFSRIFVTKVLKLVLFLVFGLRIKDANTPFRLMSRGTLMKYLRKIPEDFNLSNVMLAVLMVQAKENILFLPITFRPRQGGVNSINFTKIVRIGIRAVKDFREIRRNLKQ